jgi:hypothetical protein
MVRKTRRNDLSEQGLMTQNSRRLFLVFSLTLCFAIVIVLFAFGFGGSVLRFLFVPYQFFLIGICVGALTAATIGLIAERNEWTHYRVYFFTVMASVFLLVVINSVIFRILGGAEFVYRLMKVFFIVFRLN